MNNLFNLIVAETARMAGVPEKSIPSSKGCKKRWMLLADYWTANTTYFSDIFYKALFHITMCEYARNSKEMKSLLCLVEEAILSDNEALSCWRKHGSFIGALERLKDSIKMSARLKSHTVRLFVVGRLYCLTFYREGVFPSINIATATFKQLDRLQAAKAVEYRVKCFKDTVTMLIPDAVNWSDKQWVDEKYIFACMKSVHGVDYQADPKAFDFLFSMLRKKCAGIPYTRELFLIKHIPNSMAQAIWPQNMEKELCKQFLTICKVKPRVWNGTFFLAGDGAAPSNVVSSWVFAQLNDWRQTGSFPLSSAVRSNMLTFAVGEHPYVVRKRQRSNNVS